MSKTNSSPKVAINYDGSIVAAFSKNLDNNQIISIYRKEKNSYVKQDKSFKNLEGFINAVKINKDGSKIIFADKNNKICICDINSGSIINTLDLEKNTIITDLALSWDDKTLLSSALDDRVRIWNIEKKGGYIERLVTAKRNFYKDDEDALSVAISDKLEDGSYISAIGKYNGSIILRTINFDYKQTKVKEFLAFDKEITSISISHDGQVIATSSLDNKIKIWKTIDIISSKDIPEAYRSFNVHAQCLNVALDKNGNSLLCNNNKIIFVFDIDNSYDDIHEYFINYTHEETITGISYSGDGNTIASISDDGILKIYDIKTQEELGNIDTNKDEPLINNYYVPDCDFKLSCLKIQNYKNLKNIEIKNLKNFNVLIGKNNSGKSNLLKALNIIVNNFHKGLSVDLTGILSDKDFYNLDDNNKMEFLLAYKIENIIDKNELKISIFENYKNISFKVVILNEENYRLSIIQSITLFNNENDENNIYTLQLNDKLISQLFDFNFVKNLLLIDDSKWGELKANNFNFFQGRTIDSGLLRDKILIIINQSQTFSIFLGKIKTLIQGETKQLEKAFINIAKTNKQFLDCISQILYKLYTNYNNKIVYIEENIVFNWQEYAKSYSTLSNRKNRTRREKIHNSLKDILNAELELVSEPNSLEFDINKIPIELQGAGFRNILNMFFMNEFEKPEIIIIDEPENGIHPDLQRRFFDFIINKIKEQNIQMFISTHSPLILKYPDQVMYYKIQNLGKNIEQINKESIHTLISGLGLRPSDIFNSDICILVEGKSEVIFFKHIIRNLYKNDFKDLIITIQQYGGGAAQAIVKGSIDISNITPAQKYVLWIHDKDSPLDDENPSKDAKAFKNAIIKTGHLCHIWKKREIEYYYPKEIHISAQGGDNEKEKFTLSILNGNQDLKYQDAKTTYTNCEYGDDILCICELSLVDKTLKCKLDSSISNNYKKHYALLNTKNGTVSLINSESKNKYKYEINNSICVPEGSTLKNLLEKHFTDKNQLDPEIKDLIEGTLFKWRDEILY